VLRNKASLFSSIAASYELSADLRVIPKATVGRKRWDEFVDSNDYAWLWHRYDVLQAFGEWNGSIDNSFAIVGKNNAIKAIIPLRHKSRFIFKYFCISGLESFGGIIYSSLISAREKNKISSAIDGFFYYLSKKMMAAEFAMSIPPMAPAYRGELTPNVNPLLEIGFESKVSQVWVLDLRKRKESLWDGLKSRARRSIRKARKSRVEIRTAGPDDLDIYYSLHTETYRRTGVNPHPISYFRSIWTGPLKLGLAKIWIAEIDGEPVAALNLGVYKNAGIYWTGAANARGLDSNANSLLHWNAIEWMLKNNIFWYEVGEAFPSLISGKSKGISDFKKNFGGSLYPFYRGSLPAFNIFSRIYRFRDSIIRLGLSTR